jgi:phosphatidylethanolamine-binding protein (PEBP) family uncharacterized protein
MIAGVAKMSLDPHEWDLSQRLMSLRSHALPAGFISRTCGNPDAPLPRPVVHLIATGIPHSSLSEGALSPAECRTINFGRGSFGRIGYTGPRPVRGHGVHRYLFQIFALAERLALPGTPDFDTTVSGITRSAHARGRLTGVFERR